MPMIPRPGVAQSAVFADLEPMVRDLQSETIWVVLPLFPVASFALVALHNEFPNPLVGLAAYLVLLLLPGLIWYVHRLGYLASAWVLIAGCMLADLLIAFGAGLHAVICLLAVPAGLATLLVNAPAGAALAALCTVLLWRAPATLLPMAVDQRVVAILQVWSAVGLIWLTLRPLLTTLQWSWSSYEQNRKLLGQARDSQVRLKQTLKDLAAANIQLTRLNHLAQGLREAAEEARRAKEEFVANVSHELRTPLNMIIGFSEMIVGSPETYGGKLPSALLADLSVILRNSQHLSGLIDDVLDLSQIEAGRMALTRERVSLSEIVEAAATAVRPLFSSKGLYLETDVPRDLMIFGDRTRVREVVLNLLSNAGRFTERGGVRVRAWREGGQAAISVADTGPGITEEDQRRLFEPFQQLDGSIRRRYGGSGLGLNISRSFVELHGGRMWLESEVGTGTTFFVHLPLDAPVRIQGSPTRWLNPHWEYSERTPASLTPPPVVRPRFVVLEIGDTLKRLLRRYLGGVEAVGVGSLPEALQELSRVPARALLINGASVTESLQRLLDTTALPYGTPAIVCSVPGSPETAGALGVSSYLVKPVSREALLTALDQLQTPVRTLLVVDDEPEVQRLLRRMLASAGRGYRVLRAADGEQALSILGRQRPDAILLDLAMQNMDGFQFLAAKDADPTIRDIPTIVLSARDPIGQPVVSNALAASCGGGLSVGQVLGCIEALTHILSTTGHRASARPTGALSA